MNQKFNELREQYHTFEYRSYTYENTEDSIIIIFDFSIMDKIQFKPRIEIKKSASLIKNIDGEILNNMIFQLGMIELISYWKATCSPKIIVRAGYLSDSQIKWWKYLYFNGLGEFFYVNNIKTDINEFVNIEIDTKQNTPHKKGIHINARGNLIPIGGGKDSAVSLELLSDLKSDNTCFLLNPLKASIETCKKAKYNDENIIIVERTIDKSLLELNKDGFLNGHTPFSAMLGFLTILNAYLFGKRYIVLSNEASANESTVKGTLINHQYSKSYDFEKRFDEYVKEYITEDIHYFSLLRGINELQIAKAFSKATKYHAVFRSCNVGSKKGLWCGHCPKCLFVYIILSPFLTNDSLKGIFGNDLLNEASMEKSFRELTGIEEVKPFECVGTVEDVISALKMYIKDRQSEVLPYLVEKYQWYLDKQPHLDNLNYYNEENNIPTDFKNVLTDKLGITHE